MTDEPEPAPHRGHRKTRAGGAKKRPTRYEASTSRPPPELALALRAHRKGMIAEAIQGYQAALDRDPSCLDVWMNLASLWALGGLASAASRAFASALALAPRDARAHRDAGIGLVAVGEHAAARAALVRALDLDPALLGARLALARLCGDTGDPEAWEHHARLAIESAPHDASAHLELHRALFDDQALAPCIEAARQAVALDPGYALARLFLAGALLHEGRRPEADLALGPPGLLAPGLRDALDHATRDPARNRCFSAKERTLRFALAQCTLPGVVIELGVRHGVSTRVLAAHGAEKIHGFDSFTGLPEAWQHRAPGAFSTAGELPAVPPAVSLHVGLFADTLPPFARTLDGSIRMLHIDSDLYESALTGLVCLAPHIVPGTIIVLDEYLGNASWRQDEHRALAEAAAHFGWSIEELSLGWITGQGVVQVRERA